MLRRVFFRLFRPGATMEDHMRSGILQRGSRLALLGFAVVGLGFAASPAAAAEPAKIGIDYAYYNPVGLLMKDKSWLEQEFATPRIPIEWVYSAGSNKALEFLNGGAVDFGSSAGSAALLAKANGNPIKAVYIYSKPEWTALVSRKDSPLKSVAELKGKRIAATPGTDPGIFLLRALHEAGLKPSDVKIVTLQHADGKTALERGDVDAWSGLDPFMAQTELEQGSHLFYRNPDLNTYGFLNVREDFAKRYPQAVVRVLTVYEKARHYALDHPDELRAALVKAAKLSDAVAAKELERTDISDSMIGDKQRQAIVGAGGVLKESGIMPDDTDAVKVADALIDPQYVKQVAAAPAK
jgi:sulfonate transport system substrate-binding protein